MLGVAFQILSEPGFITRVSYYLPLRWRHY